MRIFYVTEGVFVAGGQLINLEHVAALRRMGLDARFLIVRTPADPAFVPSFPPGLEAPWQLTAPDLAPDDVVVVGEMFGQGLTQLISAPARKVIHNQNWFYSFQAFLDMPSVRRWGAQAIIAGSRIGADNLVEMGWDGPIFPVRVFVDPVFAGDPLAPRTIKIACQTRKRSMDARLIRGVLRSRRPDLDEVPWVEVADVTRPQAAAMMSDCAVFLSLSSREGLGLPPLEAMAGGALVVGYHGVGGLEYATAENGDWFDDAASHVEIADRLAERLDALKAGERFEGRRRAGAATAASFSRERFEIELKTAWEAILG
ncbi:MAG: glycosyltransferase [Phenylobacterium sp.]